MIEVSGFADEALGEVRVDAPVAILVRIGQGVT